MSRVVGGKGTSDASSLPRWGLTRGCYRRPCMGSSHEYGRCRMGPRLRQSARPGCVPCGPASPGPNGWHPESWRWLRHMLSMRRRRPYGLLRAATTPWLRAQQTGSARHIRAIARKLAKDGRRLVSWMDGKPVREKEQSPRCHVEERRLWQHLCSCDSAGEGSTGRRCRARRGSVVHPPKSAGDRDAGAVEGTRHLGCVALVATAKGACLPLALAAAPPLSGGECGGCCQRV